VEIADLTSALYEIFKRSDEKNCQRRRGSLWDLNSSRLPSLSGGINDKYGLAPQNFGYRARNGLCTTRKEDEGA